MTENIDCMNKSDASPLSSCDQQQIDLIIETEITMEETFDCLNKSDASPPSSCIQQQIVSNTEIEIVMDESKNDELVKPADEIPRSRSYKLIEKFRRLSITSILSNRKGRKASCHTILATQIDIASIPNGAPKLKGILKNSAVNRSYQDSINKPHDNQRQFHRVESYPGPCNTTDDKENSNSLSPLDNSCDTPCSSSNSSITDKHVRFCDDIIEREYISESVPDMGELSERQQKKLKNFQRKGSVNLYAAKRTQAAIDRRASADSLQLQHQQLPLFVM